MSIFSKTVLSLSIAVACCGITPLPLAQQNTTDSVDRPEEMTVTGSRIKCQGGTPSPVQELNLEALNQTGAVSLGDMLQELPSVGASLNGNGSAGTSRGNSSEYLHTQRLCGGHCKSILWSKQ